MVMYQNGIESGFQGLYERHSSRIYNFLKKRVRNEEKLAEIYQEVFVKIHKSKSLYNRTLPVLPWFFTITRSVMLDSFKKDKNFKYSDNFDFNTITATPGPDAENLSKVSELIQNLPNLQKKAVQMRYVDEKTFDEIAAALNTTPLNVRQIISRGIKHLKTLVTDGGKS